MSPRPPRYTACSQCGGQKSPKAAICWSCRYPSAEARFLRLLVDTDRDLNECWLWPKRISPYGYGVFWADGKDIQAHIFSYRYFIGPVPDGLELDHLCRNRACFNPRHLEPVTPRENVMRSPIAPAAVNSRKTQCIHGHPFDEANTYIRPNGHRDCLTCVSERGARSYQRRLARASA